MLFPKVRLKGIEAPEPKLLWHKVKRGGQDGGEILAECELFLVRSSSLDRSVFRLFVFVHKYISYLANSLERKKKRLVPSSQRACVVPSTSRIVCRSSFVLFISLFCFCFNLLVRNIWRFFCTKIPRFWMLTTKKYSKTSHWVFLSYSQTRSSSWDIRSYMSFV